MLERSCFHIDAAEPTKHKSGWSFSSYHFTTNIPGYERMEFKACDYDHALKQARAFARKHNGAVIA